MVAVTIAVAGPGSVKGSGIDCRSSCKTELPQGTSVHLEAAPNAGARFSGWSGACTGTGSCDFAAAQDVTVSAAFGDIPIVQRVYLSVNVSGSGRVTSAPAAIACPGTCSAAFDAGSALQLTATADSGFAFAGWSGACTGSGACAFSIGKDETVGATFTRLAPTQRTLSVALSGNGTVTSAPVGISCPGTCSASFDDGTPVTLTAAANTGSAFSGWSGACTGQGSCVVTMTADQSVGASFAATTPISVTIAPPAASLAPGGTQRFTATVSGSADTAVAWSVTEGAAGGSIDSSGLYTAPQALGTFHVVAASHADPSRTATATVTVAKAGSSISSCRQITEPGTFAVPADLSSPGTCLDIHDTHGVTIDCGGRTVGGSPALSMTNVDGFSLTNCNFASTSSIFVVNLTQVSNGTFQHDTFGTTWVNVVHATDVRIDQNTFNASYQQNYSHRVVISSNTLVSQTRGPAYGPALIISNSGSGNQIVGNVMDGKWSGSGWTDTDDGVVITDESGDTVSGNTISNVFDCGIETVGVITNATISNNTITRTGFCGIGGWYWNSLRSSTISGNVGTGVRRLFYFFRYYGLRPAGFDGLHELPADTAVYFSDNVFEGNRLVNPSVEAGDWASILRVYNKLDYTGSISSAPGERVPASSDFVLTNNIFRNNDFGHAFLAPSFGAPIIDGLVIDGGGNLCDSSAYGAYPLVCH